MDMVTWSVAFDRGHYLRKIFGVLKGHLLRIRDLLRVRKFDLVYVHMWVTPFGTTIFERLVRALTRGLVYDIEDNIMIGQPGAANEHPNPIARLLRGPNKARFLVSSSDHVITSSPFLNEFCLALNRHRACTYISSSIDTDRFLPVNRYRNEGPVTIGWTGTFSSRPYLDLLRNVFTELATRVDFKLKVIGNFDYDLPDVPLEVVRWTRENEVSDLQTFDIGVYPLPIDDWVFGKSGLKAIQYMAFGLPAVATDVGTTPLIIRHGHNGLLVKTEADWLEALELLVKDPELRRRLGEAARIAAVENYSTTSIAGQYQRVLQDVTGK
jgi:glycosyltransferase involved in cell wall biosynthesis